MKTKQERYYLSAAACLVAALCLMLCTAACTDDDRTPATDPTPGTVPLILAVDVASPATATTTRANTAAGVWTDGDVVAVEMDGVVKKYIARAPAGAVATLRPADSHNTHYWPAKTASVRAWYYGGMSGFPWSRVPRDWYVAASQNNMPSEGESSYQRSDFLYAPMQTVTYAPQQQGAAAGLTFYHQTARVVVRLRNAGLMKDANKEKIHVWLGAGPHTTYEIWNGAAFDASPIDPAAGQYSGLTANTEAEGSLNSVIMRPIPGIPAAGYACCYEALVIPQDMSGKHFIQVYIISGSGAGTYYYIPAAGEADLHGGYTYTYDITVSRHGTLHVTAATPIAGWTDEGEGGSGTAYELINPANPPAISDNGVYLLTGTAIGMTLNITGGNPTVIVRDLNLKGSIHITGGTPEIRVEGTNNSIRGYDNPPVWLDGDDANVRITGGGADKSRLILDVNADEPNAAIGTKGTLGKADFRCGNIDISGLTLDADARPQNMVGLGGAAIGTGGGEGNRKCGNIDISDARIIASPAGGAAAIGFGCARSDTDMRGTTYEMGSITLTNSTIESYIAEGQSDIYPAHIGGGAVMAENYTIGDIIFKTNKSGAEFFAQFNGGTKADGEVIVGFPGGAKSWPTRWSRLIHQFHAITWGIASGL